MRTNPGVLTHAHTKPWARHPNKLAVSGSCLADVRLLRSQSLAACAALLETNSFTYSWLAVSRSQGVIHVKRPFARTAPPLWPCPRSIETAETLCGGIERRR